MRRDGHELAAWDLAVVADQPPTAEWTDNPARAPGSQQTRLPWRASDDYGVVSLQAEMRLRDRRDAPPLVVSLPLPGGTPKSAHGVSQQDLTAHPWAGLPVIAKLVARDALNQTGESRERRVRPAGAAVPEPGGARADGDPPRPQPASGRSRIGGERAGSRCSWRRSVQAAISAPT